MCSQGDISCGSSSHPDFIKNYFLSNFLKLPLKFSVASHPGWQNGTINVTQCVAALNIFTHQSQLFTLRQEDHLLPLVVSRSDRALNPAFQKKTNMSIFFSSDFSKSANTEAAGGEWKDIFQCCSAGPEEVYDHPLCQSCLEIPSQNFICLFSSGDLAHESDQRTLQRCIR